MAKGFTLVELLVVIAIIAALAAMATPVILKQKKKADMTEAVNNAKQIFYLMIEFDGDFGEFPSDDSASDIDTDLTLGSANSNDYFRQFIGGGYTSSEEIFYAKSNDTKKPDNAVNGTSALEAGEVGFAYLTKQSTSQNSARPLVMAPMIEGGETFDPSPYDNKAVVLRIDGSVKQLRVNKEKEAVLTGQTTLFDSGTGTVFEDDPFTQGDLSYPLPK